MLQEYSWKKALISVLELFFIKVYSFRKYTVFDVQKFKSAAPAKF